MRASTTSGTELLDLRLRTLDADVTRVRDAVTVAEGRNAGVRAAASEAERTFDQIGGMLSEIGDRVKALLGLVDDQRVRDVVIDASFRNRPGSEVLRDAREVTRLAGDVEDAVRQLRDRVNELRKPHVSFSSPLTEKLKRSLGERCQRLAGDIAQLRSQLDADDRDPDELWARFAAMLQDDARPLFQEYVEFLGGVTVRDTGLDGRMGDMTEVLLSLYQGIAPWFPIPAAQAALSSAMDSVVKIGFPEWSIWGVPLAAHEVGVAVAHGNHDEAIGELLATWRDRGYSPALLEDLVGDGFAAYYSGPAYGCAALLLRFHPCPPAVDADAGGDVARARLVLAVLRAAVRDEDGSSARTVRALAEVWDGTVGALGGGAAAATDWVDELAASLLGVLSPSLGPQPFDEDAQQRVHELRKPLGAAAVDPDSTWERDVVAGLGLRRDHNDLRALLNAAWAERLSGSVGPDDLADRVRRLWSKTTTAPSSGRRWP